MNVIDLDILRPEKKIIKLGGHEIDVSFVPTGIMFELYDELITLYDIKQKIAELQLEQKNNDKTDVKKITESLQKESHRALDSSVSLCAIFCKPSHPELTTEWFTRNASVEQIRIFVDEIQSTIARIDAGVKEHSKN